MQRPRSPYTGHNGLSAGFLDAATAFSGSSFSSGDFNTPKFTGPPSPGRYSDDGLNSMPFLTQAQLPQSLMRSLNPKRLDHSCGDSVHASPRIAMAARQIIKNFNNDGSASLDSGNFSFDGAGDAGMFAANPLGLCKDSNIASQNQACPLLRKMTQRTMPLGKLRLNDSDSESEYCVQLKSVCTKETQATRCQRVFYYIMSTLPLQRQRQMGALLQRCSECTAFKLLLMLLQLISILFGSVIKHVLQFGQMTAGLRFKLWRCRFQLRSTIRDLLWRMTNAKTNDTLLFLIVLLAAPWLFLIGLFGFFITLMYTLKTGLMDTLRQMRLRLAY